MGVAVIVYFIVRFTKTYTDVFVNRLFFADRKRRIGQIMQIADDVEDRNDPEEIAPFVSTALRERAGLTARVHFDTRAVLSADVAERLRRERAPLSDDAGAITFPMVIRKELRGILVCEHPERDSAFAPDEVRALAELASRIVTSREDLLAQAFLRKDRSEPVSLQ